MLRVALLMLVLANGVYFAWSHALLAPYGFAPAMQNEPQRVAQQIQPGAIRILSTADVKRIEAQMQAELAPHECLQAGPFDEAQAGALRLALDRALPSGAWQLNVVLESERWIVYMGAYPNAEALAKKRAQLAARNFKMEVVSSPGLENGLSLGRFDSQQAANAELLRLSQRGIRTARVVQEREASRTVTLKIPAAVDALKAKLEEIKPALAGKPFKKCN